MAIWPVDDLTLEDPEPHSGPLCDADELEELAPHPKREDARAWPVLVKVMPHVRQPMGRARPETAALLCELVNAGRTAGARLAGVRYVVEAAS
jgi:hypothetical protein